MNSDLSKTRTKTKLGSGEEQLKGDDVGGQINSRFKGDTKETSKMSNRAGHVPSIHLQKLYYIFTRFH